MFTTGEVRTIVRTFLLSEREKVTRKIEVLEKRGKTAFGLKGSLRSIDNKLRDLDNISHMDMYRVDRMQRAMEYLIKNRIKFHHKCDFIMLANKHKTNKIVEKYTEKRGGDIKFCDCGSWDGISRRCSCGRVRCMWDWDEVEFDDPNAFRNMNFRIVIY